MIDFLLLSANLPFTIALAFMCAIGLLEIVTSLLGLGASNFIESVWPSLDLDVDIDIDVDQGGLIPAATGPGSAIGNMLGWLGFGKVPAMVMLVLMLLGFGIIGLAVQSAAMKIRGLLLPGILASGLALVGAICFVRVAGRAVSRILPRDESEAVSEKSFLGRIAVVTAGTAKRGHPAQAKLRDQHGRTHYVMVEPDSAAEEFEAGSEVLLVMRECAVFYAIGSLGQSWDEAAEDIGKHNS